MEQQVIPLVRTYATFFLVGDTLKPADITARLEITPAVSFQAGDKRGANGVWKHGYWELTSQDQVVSDDLADHLVWLLDQLEAKREQLARLAAEDIQPTISCFWEASGSGGPVFSAQLLRRLAALHLELQMDIYFAS
ncbi:MAG: DUF4279 domain-containing protein [Leptolyngbyaceae cyanobacterium SM1_3_5]|nr:DUF4279 domain-containing protein [Leptolyngbyaceae cyanobacterium SM1_3_5]